MQTNQKLQIESFIHPLDLHSWGRKALAQTQSAGARAPAGGCAREAGARGMLAHDHRADIELWQYR